MYIYVYTPGLQLSYIYISIYSGVSKSNNPILPAHLACFCKLVVGFQPSQPRKLCKSDCGTHM